MGGHQKSVKTKSFLGQLCDEKNSVPYPSGNFRGCGAEFFCDRETGDSAGFCCGDTRIFSPLLYQLSYLGILISCWKPLLI